MKVLVTGASGFIGRHAVSALIKRGHTVIATSRSAESARKFQWFDEVRFVPYDVYADPGGMPSCFGNVDALIHLAWQGLPNYQAPFHYEKNLFHDYRFLKSIVEQGVKHLLVTGSSSEYGMQYGCLNEDMLTQPVHCYGLAKDTLRKFLQKVQSQHPFLLQWIRPFYLYGPGQNPNSMLVQLDKAIDLGAPVFNMSGGEQLRDFLAVEELARRLVIILEHPELVGIINCCSGKPISLRRLAENRIAERNARIELNLGYYPYPDYEPMAFWGSSQKFFSIHESGYNEH
ncbi:MAG: NAD(P)-dependent oxidoreductase [Candidatus Methylumidiphilus sp.]